MASYSHHAPHPQPNGRLTVVVRHPDDVAEHVRHGAGGDVRFVDVAVDRDAVRVIVTDLPRHRHARLAVLETRSSGMVDWCQTLNKRLCVLLAYF